jgi:hypothetical protein
MRRFQQEGRAVRGSRGGGRRGGGVAGRRELGARGGVRCGCGTTPFRVKL